MESIGFTTSDGGKHLGYRLSAAKIGEPWEFGPSVYGFYYFDEEQDRLAPPINDIKDVFPVTVVDFYYWDAELNDYQRLSPSEEPSQESSLAIFSSEYREKLITDSKPAKMALFRTIRRWIILNAKCSKPVYINKDYTIHSEGEIVINADALSQIPDYIHIRIN